MALKNIQMKVGQKYRIGESKRMPLLIRPQSVHTIFKSGFSASREWDCY